MSTYDVAVIGAGIAGAGVAWELADRRRVVIVEGEERPGYHTTGRSAAVYLKGYGNDVIRDLTAASEAFFEAPPDGFASTALVRPRGALTLVRADQRERLEPTLSRLRRHVPSARRLDADQLLGMVPALNPDYAVAAIYDPGARDMDVDALFQAYLRGYRGRGGELFIAAPVRRLERADGIWRLTAGNRTLQASIVVNAAGAWADTIAGLAGLQPIGLVPKRRTALIVAGPAGYDVGGWPVVDDIDEQFYFRPEAGKLLCSPADETPSGPCDARPEELDIAIAIDRIERALPLNVRRVEHSWAGLRTFATDKTPVVGFDPRAPGFFWLAGQGGYGIQTSPAMALLASTLIKGEAAPTQIAHLVATLSPERMLH
jgi:D-arginine dehydrogenase